MWESFLIFSLYRRLFLTQGHETGGAVLITYFWVKDSHKVSGSKQPLFLYASPFCERGIQAGLSWATLLLHAESTGVPRWYSVDCGTGLEGPQ